MSANRMLISKANWPEADHRLLLQILLRDDREASQNAWTTWIDNHDLDDIDPASFFVLPQLFLKLKSIIGDCSSLDRIRGVYRQTWLRNQLYLQGLFQVVELFESHQIPCVTMKGMNTLLFCYRDLGARVMYDFDVLVPERNFEKSVAVLREHAWTEARNKIPPAELRRYWHAWGFKSPIGQFVDLHYRAASVDTSKDFDSQIIGRSVVRQYQGKNLRVPEPTDCLLLVCLHARKRDPQSACRWLLDLSAILSTDEIDWNQLLQRANQSNILLPVREALTFASQEFGLPVPDSFLQEAWKIKATRRQIQKYNRLTRMPLRGNPIKKQWWRYQSGCRSCDERAGLLGFGIFLSTFCKWRFGLKSRWQLPLFLATELRQSPDPIAHKPVVRKC